MQILGILFRTIPPKKTQLGIPFRAKKIEINSRNAILNHSVERNQHHIVKLFCCCFKKLVFSTEFHSVLFRSELRNWLCFNHIKLPLVPMTSSSLSQNHPHPLLATSLGMLLKTSMMAAIRDCFFVRGSVNISPRYAAI